ncbi:hypothetical protein IFT47_17685 [Pseudomonas sp. CFBP 13711]|uniref:hypothetical protein n=1 Tax=unclassified Pseudomonas TaxID=196821 RepID=UPI00178378D3|nr:MULTISPECIES: hypothetical protein [unclassified Pseudomonas]MBD8708464.1 hypothetical protein [Pseudomonas sp. CFBP 13711]MBD8713906.1 hypothetical protein [Pseudomonas sp. CFBP 13715]
MEDDRAIELYASFRKNIRDKLITTIVSGPNLSGGKPMPGMTLGMYQQSVSDFLRELANSTNDFRGWINTLAAWAPVYNACDQDERLSLIKEHISPYSALVLGAPQALKGRIMFAAATSCGLANHQLTPSLPGLQWNGSKFLTMAVASKIGQPWINWRRLAPILGELGHGPISEGTDDYRNQREHGHPRNIGIGITTYVSVEEHSEGRTLEFGLKQAIPLETVIEVAVGQHAVAVKAYEALCDLAQEQFGALMAAARATPVPNA